MVKRNKNWKKWLPYIFLGLILNVIGLGFLAGLVPHFDNKIDLKQDNIELYRDNIGELELDIMKLKDELDKRIKNYEEIIRCGDTTSNYENFYTIFSKMTETKNNSELLNYYYEKWRESLVFELRGAYSFYNYGRISEVDLENYMAKWREMDIPELEQEMHELSLSSYERTEKEINSIFTKIDQKKIEMKDFGVDINSSRNQISKFRDYKASCVKIGFVIQIIGAILHVYGIYLGKKITP